MNTLEFAAQLAVEWVFAQDHIATTLTTMVTEGQLTENLDTAMKMSKPESKKNLESNAVFQEAKAILDDLVCSNWEACEVANYWKKMKDGNFIQNLDEPQN